MIKTVICWDGQKAAGKHIRINWVLADIGEQYFLMVKNGVLNHRANERSDTIDILATVNCARLDEIMRTAMPFKKAVEKSMIQVEGTADMIAAFVSLIDTFDSFFNIVTP